MLIYHIIYAGSCQRLGLEWFDKILRLIETIIIPKLTFFTMTFLYIQSNSARIFFCVNQLRELNMCTDIETQARSSGKMKSKYTQT